MEPKKTGEQTISHLKVTIGWICALPKEYYEAVKMFDEIYDANGIPKGTNDKNTYELGRIGDHHVAMNIPSASNQGQTRAAIVANDMMSTFPRLKFILLVGIGGASPCHKNDIRLGDVVFGAKVVPYKFGAETDNGFVNKGIPRIPDDFLRMTITRFFGKLQKGMSMQTIIDAAACLPRPIMRPAIDNLYRADYICKETDCDCASPVKDRNDFMVPRNGRDPCNYVHIHNGVIGSADQVMKNAKLRSQHAAEHGIICFEMEAMGVMDATNCLTIRGISDYSDGHKNDDWHCYASLTAAVSAKEFLRCVDPNSNQAGIFANSSQMSDDELEAKIAQLKRCVDGAVHSASRSTRVIMDQSREFDTVKQHMSLLVDLIGIVQNIIADQTPCARRDAARPDTSQNKRNASDRVRSLNELQTNMISAVGAIQNQVHEKAKTSKQRGDERSEYDWKGFETYINEKTHWAERLSNKTQKDLLQIAKLLQQSDEEKHQKLGLMLQAASDNLKELTDTIKYMLSRLKHKVKDSCRSISHLMTRSKKQDREKENKTSEDPQEYPTEDDIQQNDPSPSIPFDPELDSTARSWRDERPAFASEERSNPAPSLPQDNLAWQQERAEEPYSGSSEILSPDQTQAKRKDYPVGPNPWENSTSQQASLRIGTSSKAPSSLAESEVPSPGAVTANQLGPSEEYLKLPKGGDGASTAGTSLTSLAPSESHQGVDIPHQTPTSKDKAPSSNDPEAVARDEATGSIRG